VRVYLTLGRSPVEANSVVVVVVTICIVNVTVSGLFTLGWMCPLKREQATRERESELRLVNSLYTLL